MESWASGFRRHESYLADQRKYGNPVMYDPVTLKPIDYAEAAKAEEKRAAEQLGRDQQAYQEQLKRYGEA